MNTKSIITAVACGASLLLIQPLHAQSPSPAPSVAPSPSVAPGEDHGHGRWHHHGEGGPLEHLTRELNLTEDQKAKIKPILEQNKPQFEAIHKEAAEKAKVLRESVAAQIKPLLTPEQQQKLDQMQQQADQRGDHHGRRFGGPGAEGRGARMADKLGLTDDQKAKVKAVFEASKPQIEAIRSNTSLSEDQKRDQIKAIRESNHTQIRALLTPEQQQKFDAMKAERKEKRGGKKE